MWKVNLHCYKYRAIIKFDLFGAKFSNQNRGCALALFRPALLCPHVDLAHISISARGLDN